MDTPPTPPIHSLLAEADRLRAARHILANEIEQALERFTTQTALKVYALDIEHLSSVGGKLRYFVSPNVPL
jgi:hypothetical protein